VNVILFLRRATSAHRIHVSGPLALGAVSLVLVVLLGGAFYAGLHLGERSNAAFAADSPAELRRIAAQQKTELDRMREQLQQRVDSIAARMGQINAHVLRMDALGKRLVQMADIDSREFDFTTPPATGGPETAGVAPQVPDLTAMLDRLESRLMLRDSQMGALENLIMQRELRAQILPDGRPVKRGFISSYFGDRQDPLTGHGAFHTGVDFAGNLNDPVVSVGAGVVTFVGDQAGYGAVVEVTHGDGYVTRYAHNAKIIVRRGDTVQRGQTLALMGSSGRSTGPHVHFEVLRADRPVNPLSYIGG
jgi:murein DD-endopeptidase MepM/ murein hydrolase activator NlpD